MTDGKRHRRASEIFLQACELPPDEQASFIEMACGGDAELRAQVESFLNHGRQAAEKGATRHFEEVAGRAAEGLPENSPVESGAAPTPGPGSAGLKTKPPERIGCYRIIRLIARGGMGEVYEAEQSTPVKRVVAVKVIRVGLDSADVLARFMAERQALALMSHPYIAAIHDAGATQEGRPYVVMEYVDGEPVTEYVRRHHLDLGARLDLFLKICEAVSHAHQKGVIHRDLKPSNILVTGHDGRVVPKVIDFGIAKAIQQPLTERTLQTSLGQLVGTPEYMSPEQAAGTGLDADTRADVYALGGILYQLLSGAHPLPRQMLKKVSLEEMLRLIREYEPARPSERVSTLSRRLEEKAPGGMAKGSQAQDPDLEDEPETASMRPEGGTLPRMLAGDLDWITLRALEKDRERRYTSVIELSEDIRRYLRCEPVLAGPPSRSYRLKKFVKRNRAGVAFGMVLMAVLVAATAAVTWQWRTAVAERERAEVAGEMAMQEAARAERINAFLQEMLASADPARMGRDVTVRDVLNQAAKTLERDLSADPGSRADAHHTLGETYTSLGSLEQGRHHLETALALRRELHEGDYASIAVELKALGQCLLALDNAREARRLILDGLRMRRRIAPEPDVFIAESLLALALADLRLLDYEGAERLARASTRQAEALGARHEPVLAKTLQGLSIVLQKRADQEGAEQAARKSLAIHEHTHGRNHPATLKSLELVALSLMIGSQSSENAAAIRDIRSEVLERARAVFGEDHPRVAEAENQLAVFLMLKTPHLAEARAHQANALRIWRQTFDSEHTYLVSALNNLGFVEHHLGHLAEAGAHYEEALAMSEKLPFSRNMLTTLANLSMVRHHEGRYQEALDIYQKWQRDVAGLATASSERMVFRSLDHACLMLHMGRLEETQKLLFDAEGMLDDLEGQDIRLPAHRRSLRHIQGFLRARENRWPEAEELMAEVLAQLAEQKAGFLGRRHSFKTGKAISRAGGRIELADSYARALEEMESQLLGAIDSAP